MPVLYATSHGRLETVRNCGTDYGARARPEAAQRVNGVSEESERPRGLVDIKSPRSPGSRGAHLQEDTHSLSPVTASASSVTRRHGAAVEPSAQIWTVDRSRTEETRNPVPVWRPFHPPLDARHATRPAPPCHATALPRIRATRPRHAPSFPSPTTSATLHSAPVHSSPPGAPVSRHRIPQIP
ncbi:hypothetical protein ZWY2020_049487 [Hordeum vulgare]|nr:hypothetical protein ZWY2020_049487 [Hordeum vulgare]